MISKETATDIALTYREIETAEKLLAEVQSTVTKYYREGEPDIRDSFGRRVGGLQLGVPSGPAAHTCHHVPWSLAKPVLEAHIANQRSILVALNVKAQIEATRDTTPDLLVGGGVGR